MTLQLTITMERETDGRWLASVPELPGVHVYGVSEKEAIRRVKALALFDMADRMEHGEPLPGLDSGPDCLEFVAA